MHSSKNITVFSITGRFLGHARIFCCYCEDCKPDLYLSSSDLNPGNFNNRYELTFPISDITITNYILKLIELYKSDHLTKCILNKDGSLQRKNGYSLHNYLAKNHKEIE